MHVYPFLRDELTRKTNPTHVRGWRWRCTQHWESNAPHHRESNHLQLSQPTQQTTFGTGCLTLHSIPLLLVSTSLSRNVVTWLGCSFIRSPAWQREYRNAITGSAVVVHPGFASIFSSQTVLLLFGRISNCQYDAYCILPEGSHPCPYGHWKAIKFAQLQMYGRHDRTTAQQSKLNFDRKPPSYRERWNPTEFIFILESAVEQVHYTPTFGCPLFSNSIQLTGAFLYFLSCFLAKQLDVIHYQIAYSVLHLSIASVKCSRAISILKRPLQVSMVASIKIDNQSGAFLPCIHHYNCWKTDTMNFTFIRWWSCSSTYGCRENTPPFGEAWPEAMP